MKIYIAGKISGDKSYKEKFARVQQQLESQGHVVLNPATQPEGLSAADYMRMCFAMMEAAEIVMFLPDFRESRGAMLEYDWCQYTVKQTAYYEDWSIANDNDKIAEGMKAIKEYCQAHPLCKGCQFVSSADDCELREKLPYNWETDK